MIHLRDITNDSVYQLYLYARIRCSEFKVIHEPGNNLFIGILHEPVIYSKFMRNMKANLSNWNIEHVTNKLWCEELTVDSYIRVYGGLAQLRSQAVSDAVVYDLVEKEVASIMRYKSMELCQRQNMNTDKFIKRVIFNVFVSITNSKENELKRRRIDT
jgi:hypothetical protein